MAPLPPGRANEICRAAPQVTGVGGAESVVVGTGASTPQLKTAEPPSSPVTAPLPGGSSRRKVASPLLPVAPAELLLAGRSPRGVSAVAAQGS